MKVKQGPCRQDIYYCAILLPELIAFIQSVEVR